MPLESGFEHGALVIEGEVEVDGQRLAPGALLYLGSGRSELALRGTTGGGRLMLLGGEPFDEEIVMWWNFVARSHDEIVAAREDWMSTNRFGSPTTRPIDRFGSVAGFDGDPLPAPELPAAQLRPRGRTR